MKPFGANIKFFNTKCDHPIRRDSSERNNNQDQLEEHKSLLKSKDQEQSKITYLDIPSNHEKHLINLDRAPCALIN